MSSFVFGAEEEEIFDTIQSMNQYSMEDCKRELQQKGLEALSLLPPLDTETNMDDHELNLTLEYPSALKVPSGFSEALVDRTTLLCTSNFSKVTEMIASERMISWGIIRRHNDRKLAFQFLLKKKARKARRQVNVSNQSIAGVGATNSPGPADNKAVPFSGASTL